MDYRRFKLFSWKRGYDIRDHGNREFKVLVARRIRKQEKRRLARLED